MPLNGLFLEAVSYMLSVFKRMAHWAQNLKIFQRIVVAISVFMVDAENFRNFAVAAPFAIFKHFALRHIFSDRCESRFPNLFGGFINARARTVFSWMRWGIKKLNFAMLTSVFGSSLFQHRFVIAFSRAILGFISSAGNVRKFSVANSAYCFVDFSAAKRQTYAPTIKRGVFPVFWYSKRGAAMLAVFFVPNVGAGHAVSQVGLQGSF